MELIIDKVNKKFEEKIVLTEASFTFKKGKVYALLGRNGAGKTTLFKCLMKTIKIDDGDFFITIDNEKIPYEFLDFGLVFDQSNLPDFLTGYEFINFYIDINKKSIKDLKRIEEYFALVDLKAEDYNRLIKNYSHGMKNKIQILMYLISKPKVLLLDEPLTSFDIVVASEIKDLIRKTKHEHIIILSTHILELAKDLCDEVVILHNGKLKEFNEELTDEEIKREFLSA